MSAPSPWRWTVGKCMPDDAGRDESERYAALPERQHETSEAVEQVNRKATLRAVSLRKLRDHPRQPAERHRAERVIELAASIAAHGLAQPPLVSHRADDSFVIVAGHRRVAASRLLAVDGRGSDKVQAYVIRGLSTGDELNLILAELWHRDETVSPIAIAETLGAVWREREAASGRAVTVRELVDVIPNLTGKTAVHDYRTIAEALDDPELAPLVRAADTAGKGKLCKALRKDDYSARKDALRKLAEDPAGATHEKSTRRRGRPHKAVVREERKGGYDLKIRYRIDMPVAHAIAASVALEDLKAKLDDRIAEEE